MSHKVKVTKLPKLRQDGTVIPGKYEYTVLCKRKGTCLREKFTSSVLADAAKQEHHREMQAKHRFSNPNDHQAKTGATAPRPQRKKDTWL
jgi:hypothetical protein